MYSGVGSDLKGKLMYGDCLTLKKGKDYTLTDKDTIETTNDLKKLVVRLVESKELSKDKFAAFVVDGPLRKLGNELREEFNGWALVIWCFAHRLSLMWQNALKNNKHYIDVKNGCSTIKQTTGHSNIVMNKLQHFADELMIKLKAFDGIDEMRFVVLV